MGWEVTRLCESSSLQAFRTSGNDQGDHFFQVGDKAEPSGEISGRGPSPAATFHLFLNLIGDSQGKTLVDAFTLRRVRCWPEVTLNCKHKLIGKNDKI